MHTSLLLDSRFDAAAHEHRIRALLKLTAPPRTSDFRVPLNLSIVLDRSGSMAGEKLAAARDAATLLVRRLHPEDVVSVVTYDDEVQTVAPPASGRQQRQLAHKIRSIRSGGTTNLSGGWSRGRDLVAVKQRSDGMNRVLLLTDGLANVGIQDAVSLASICRQAREAGISTTTIGFGADFDEHMLRAMADAGGGHAYYIENPDQAAGIFEEEIEGLLSAVAANVKLTIRSHGAARVSRILDSYPQTPASDALIFDLGDVYAREAKTALVEFSVPAAAQAGETLIAEFTVVADLIHPGTEVERREISIPVRMKLTEEGTKDPEIEREMLLAETAHIREQALADQARGDHASSHRRLASFAQHLRGVASPGDRELSEEIADLQRMATLCAEGPLPSMDLKYIYQRAYDRTRSKGASIGRYSRSRADAGDLAARIEYRSGDATNPSGPGRKIVAHVTDVAGQWGTGVSRSISRRWSEPERVYQTWFCGDAPVPIPFELGELQFVRVEPELYVATMVAKDVPSHPGAPPQVRYDALDKSLSLLKDQALMWGASVHMPR
ncbi:MAG: VWA domain-containing protein, partial [Gemmatimonadetes bacterium]|nr:VWA domain-containing protein [Gemmatimonadota bacterium]